MEYYKKYIKYKSKYKNLKKIYGSGQTIIHFKAPIEYLDKLKEKIDSIKGVIDIHTYYLIDDKKDITSIIVEKNLSNSEYMVLKNSIYEVIPKNYGKSIEELELEKYRELLKAIDNDNHEYIYNFLKSLTPIELYNYIIEKKNKEDHYKTILYYLSRKGNINALKYILGKIGEFRMIQLLRIPLDDNRIVLHAAINSVQNKRETYDFIKNLTDPVLYKIKFRHNTGSVIKEEKDLKQWAEIRNLNTQAIYDPESKYIYDDVCKLVEE